jgi:hypothetical protein
VPGHGEEGAQQVSGELTMAIARVPPGMNAHGRRLWRAVLTDYDLAAAEMLLLERACRVADTCDILQRQLDKTAPILVKDGQPYASPVVTELRQQSILLARLIVALRIPMADDDDEDTPGRTQRRGIRGVYSLRSA